MESFKSDILPPPVKASTDKKEYRTIRLSNKLQCLLISDTRYALDKLTEEEKMVEAAADRDEESDEDTEEEEEDAMEEEEEEEEDDEEEEEEDDNDATHKKSVSQSGLKKSAAGLCVGMGSFSDPLDLPGLAHFLEHMVFMGSKKYPDENSFDKFIQKSGGFDNASTDCETTVFYFETQRKYFQKALDRFAQFFIDPLMKQNAMQREREAVDSEFEMALMSDYNRRQQIFGSLAVDGHPMSKFMWGNSSSLKKKGLSDKEVHKRLHEFKNQHYSSNVMTLVVQSQEELDTLQQWVEESFSAVPNNEKNRETFQHLKDPFKTEKFHKLYKVVPIKNTYFVDLNWALPAMLDAYDVKPLHYLSWIIGHEGKGSLISFLRKKVWALSLTAGNAGDGFEYNSTYSLFSINIKLTKSGFENLDKVLDSIFSYLHMLQKAGASERIYGEIQEIERLDFEFKDESQPSTNVEILCENMQFYPPENYLNGDDLMFRFDSEIISNCMNDLRPDNVNIFLMAKEFESECTLVEPWFSTKYKVEDFPADWLSSWQNPKEMAEFHLPAENKFIAKNLELKIKEDECTNNEVTHIAPTKILEEDVGELFYKVDHVFKQPRALYFFHFRSPLVQESAKDFVCLDLMIRSMCQVMTEETYPAELTQLHVHLYDTERGISLGISGLNDKLLDLLEVIFDGMAKFKNQIEPDQFRAVREEYKKACHNMLIKPSKLARSSRLAILQSVHWTLLDCHSVVSDITLDDVKAFYDKFWNSAYMDVLVQGNVSEGEAAQAFSLAKSKLGLKCTNKFDEIRCRELPKGSNTLRIENLNPMDGNTVVVNYYQLGPGSFLQHILLEVVIQIMDEPLFDLLRTKQQLGYTVFSMLRCTYGILGFSITVNSQAGKHSAEYVDERIEHFLQWFKEDKLKNMTEEEFSQVIQTLVKQKKAADVTLKEEAFRHWTEIIEKEYQFDREATDILLLDTLTLQQTREFFEDNFSSVGSNFKKMSVQVIGSAKGNVNDCASLNPDHKFLINVMPCPEGSNVRVIANPDAFKNSLNMYPATKIVQ